MLFFVFDDDIVVKGFVVVVVDVIFHVLVDPRKLWLWLSLGFDNSQNFNQNFFQIFIKLFSENLSNNFLLFCIQKEQEGYIYRVH